tara:strand:- start:253 stop:663 length:411 start_codon:yes stop_codon:yes gene_type:complete
MDIENINFKHSKLFFNGNSKIIEILLSNISEDIRLCVIGKKDIQVNTTLRRILNETSDIKTIHYALRFNYDLIVINNMEINNISDVNNITMAVECGHSVILLNCKISNINLFKEILEENFIVDLSSFVLKDKLREF